MKITKVRTGYILYKTVNGKTQQLLLEIDEAAQFVDFFEKDCEKAAKLLEEEHLQEMHENTLKSV